jgi:hypothetical protein
VSPFLKPAPVPVPIACSMYLCRYLTDERGRLRRAALDTAGASDNHYREVQADARKWNRVWPKGQPDGEGNAAPRLPEPTELHGLLTELLGTSVRACGQLAAILERYVTSISPCTSMCTLAQGICPIARHTC